MTLELSIVADVFRYEAQAKHALEALRQAGFGYDQIGIAMQGHEGIDLQSDLQNLGVSHEQASYYAREVEAGHTVVSVRPDGREQEAHEIMRRSGAFTEAESGTSQTSNIDKQKTAWEQAVASHQAYLAEQLAAKRQEDFHQPRSLKPREERVPVTNYMQTEEAGRITEQTASSTAFEQQEETTERKPIISPLVHDAVLTEQTSSVAPVLQNNEVREQLPPTEEEHLETASIDDEETLRRVRKQEPASAEIPPPQPQIEKPSNIVRNGILLGGLLLGLGTGVIVVLLQREQTRQFVLSTTRAIKTQLTTGGVSTSM